MAEYIVTDLTRFSNLTEVCIAVINRETGECFRPLPYFKTEDVTKFNIHPGAILSGEMNINASVNNPHIEDASYNKLKYLGACTGDEFKEILDRTLSESVSSGFGITLAESQKHIPIGENANCSIVTIKIPPNLLSIHRGAYKPTNKPTRIKASFRDNNFHYFSYLPITDRGFYDYAQKYNIEDNLKKIRESINSQEELYLRIGVSRKHQIKDKNGYWLQVNGIYTFPDFLNEIRTY